MGITREIVVFSCLPFKKYRWVTYVTMGQVGFITVNLFVLPTPALMAERESMKMLDGGVRVRTGNLDLEFSGPVSKQGDSSTSLIRRLTNLDFRDIFSTNNVVANLIGRPYFSGALLASMCLITAGLVYRSKRSIHMITLLPQDKVRIATFSPTAFGKPPTIEIPHSHVSCVQPREGTNTYAMLRIKNYRGIFLIDRAEGTFHEPKLFDEYLSYARSWADK